MTIILVCLFIAAALPILAKGPVAFAMNQEKGGYNNRHPRDQQKQLTGFGARAKAAHENSFEALAMFAPGALAVVATNQTGQIAQYLAISFVVARIVYLAAYYYDKHALRSSAWMVGFGVSLGLLWIAIP